MNPLRTDRRTPVSGNEFWKNIFSVSIKNSARSRRALFLACGLFLLAAGRVRASGPGTGAANFLKIPVGARETALGGAFTAVADNSNAVYYNPAGLNLLQSREISFTQNNFVEGVSQQWLAAAYPYKAGVFGLGLNYLSISAFDAYDNADNRIGSVSADDLALYFSWGGGSPVDYRFFRSVLYGASVKVISETLGTERGSGYGLDLGLLAASSVENLRFGLAVENAVSSKIKFIKKGAKPPLRFKAGAAYGLRSSVGMTLRGSLDCVLGGDSPAYLAAGLEIRINDTLSVRMGYSAFGDISNGLNFGLGYSLSKYMGRNVSVDYSFAPTYSFGDIHKLSVTYKFGRLRQAAGKPAAMSASGEAATAMDTPTAALPPQKTPIEYYAGLLKTGDPVQRRGAIAELGVRGGEDSLALLLGLLKDANTWIVRDAVSVLARFNDPRVIAPLIELFEVHNENLRLAAVSGLSRYKEKRVLEALTGRLEGDESTEVRGWAAEVLGKWESGFGAEEALQAAFKTEKDEKVRRSIISALGKFDAGLTGEKE